jgi:hypothetical protein
MDMTDDDIGFLQTCQCGFKDDSPWVCCPTSTAASNPVDFVGNFI